MKTAIMTSRGAKTATPYTLSGIKEIAKRKTSMKTNIKSINTPISGRPQVAPLASSDFEEMRTGATVMESKSKSKSKPVEPVEPVESTVAVVRQSRESAEVYVQPLTKMTALRTAKQRYVKASNGQLRSTDDLAEALDPVHPLDIQPLVMSLLQLEANPYGHLNPGQQSMNLRNKLRGAIKHDRITIAEVMEKVASYVEARRAAKAKAKAKAKVETDA